MYERIANVNEIGHEEWLELRKAYIGGSDAGAICGVNPWSSPAKVWQSKLGGAEPIKDNLKMKIGRDLEDYVARLFTEASGKKVRRNNYMMVNKKYPFMMANVDREVVGENAVLECKTTGSFSKDQWEDGQVPPHYYCQVQHYMATCGYVKGYIAALIGNEDFKWDELERDEDYISYMVEAENDFYQNNMVGGAFPEPDGSQGYSEALKRSFGQSNGAEVDLGHLESTLDELKEVRSEIKDLETEKKKLEQLIQVEMKDNELAKIGDSKVSWKTVVSNKFDKKRFEEDYPELASEYYKVSESRRFSIK